MKRSFTKNNYIQDPKSVYVGKSSQTNFNFTTMATTFSENIQAVINSNGTKATKVESLVKAFGLRKAEAEMVYNMYHESAPRHESFSYTFGVEIECGMDARTFMNNGRSNGLTIDYVGRYTHSNDLHAIRICADSSVNVDGLSQEVVTPVLNSKSNSGFKTLKTMCAALSAAGAKVNRSCGLHVHIGASHLTQQQYVNVFKNYRALELIIDSFMADSRRANNNHYCYSLRNLNLADCVTREHVRSAMHCSRYYKVNAESYGNHTTIEFRQHQGSTDYEKISNWVKFCAKLVQWSMNNVLTSDVASIDEIPFLTASEKAFFKGRANALA